MGNLGAYLSLHEPIWLPSYMTSVLELGQDHKILISACFKLHTA
jgi:hypothetical protein